ncbi:MAG: Hsp20/alpha crystallin family protein [Candidatus Saccharibacteria bacterium]
MSNLVRLPFRDLDRFFEDDFFMPVMGRLPKVPAVDLYETENEVVAEVSIPGMDPKKVAVEIENNVLHIRGEEAAETEDRSRGYYHKEVRRGAFARSLTLPVDVDPGRVTAESRNGMLKVVMPKSEKARAKKIDVEIKE